MKLSTILIYVYPILSAPTSSYDPFSLFAQYSTATYCPSVFDSETLKCGKGVCTGIVEQTQIVAVGKNNQTDGFSLVGYHEELKMIVVMFRGSKTLKNLELNLELDQSVVHWLPQPSSNKAYPANIKVHQGMKKVYESIRDQIQPKALDLAKLHADWPIFFVGHSLGGALATLAATDFAFTNDLSDRVHLYTYGAPRLGNLAWAMFVDGLKFAGSRRIIQRGDPVPIIPFQEAGFYHSKTPYSALLDKRTTVECKTVGLTGEAHQSSLCAMPIGLLDVTKHTGYYGWVGDQSC